MNWKYKISIKGSDGRGKCVLSAIHITVKWELHSCGVRRRVRESDVMTVRIACAIKIGSCSTRLMTVSSILSVGAYFGKEG